MLMLLKPGLYFEQDLLDSLCNDPNPSFKWPHWNVATVVGIPFRFPLIDCLYTQRVLATVHRAHLSEKFATIFQMIAISKRIRNTFGEIWLILSKY